MKRRYYLICLFLFGTTLVPNAKGASLLQPFLSLDTTSVPPLLIGKSQALQDSITNLRQLPGRYFNKVSAKADHFNNQLSKRSAKALRRMRKQEDKINRKLLKIDSLAARNLFVHSIDSLDHLQTLVKGKVSTVISRIPGGQYLAHLDTLQSALGFLSKYQSQLQTINGAGMKLQNSLNSVKELEGRLDQVQNVQQYIDERKQLLTQALGQYGDMFNKNLGAISKEAYYYQAQIANYKALWQHPDQLEAKAVGILNKIPAFQAFYKKHSQLASLFNLPSDYGNTASLVGLQTRSMVERELQQRLQGAGAGGRQQIQQQLQQATQQLEQLKDKFPGLNSTAQMPDFQPKDIKSKTWLQRLEYGANFQFEKATSYFPSTSDVAVQVAYKFSDKGSMGVGSAFKLGWGTDIHHIHFTAQGLNLRSFLSYQLKGTFFVNGGLEMNYEKTIPNVPVLKNLNGWSKSALLGIERKYKISGKISGDIMVLFDFLYRQNDRQPVVLRTGYSF